jgi:DNA-binding NarL/FixJ family response regulator
MDVAMPNETGVEATRQIRAVAPDVRVLVLTSYDDPPYVHGLLDAGATSYLLKTAELSEIAWAVHATAEGKSVVDPSVASQLIARVNRSTPVVEPLTEREREVLQLAARGLTNKQIGAKLKISDRTAQNHLANIFGKLGVASRTEAVTEGLQRGWIRLSG